MILGFIAHAYVWAGEQPRDRLPKQLADPWIRAADHFGLPAVSSYAGVCLWNFKTIYPSSVGLDQAQSSQDWGLDNLATLVTFTGSYDESWFYLVSTAIERQGAPCLTHGLDAIKACRDDNPIAVVSNLQSLAESIDSMTTTLARMFEMCDPHTFYFRIRPYLAGWKDMEDAGLPYGVKYGDDGEYKQISGGSNAQSSLIHALDILLSAEHHHHHPGGHRRTANGAWPATGEKDCGSSDANNDTSNAHGTDDRSNFLLEMRKYMPQKHRDFLEALTRVAHIREYVMQHAQQTPALVISYDKCLAMLRKFRDTHLQTVSRYIVTQARKAQKRESKKTAVAVVPQTHGREGEEDSGEAGHKGNGKPAEPKREGLATSSPSKSALRGPSGTALIPFLKQARGETGDPAASAWGRRLLADANRSFGSSHSTILASFMVPGSLGLSVSSVVSAEPVPAGLSKSATTDTTTATAMMAGNSTGPTVTTGCEAAIVQQQQAAAGQNLGLQIVKDGNYGNKYDKNHFSKGQSTFEKLRNIVLGYD